jgi:DNA-binding MarR family transcriptional regulator
VSERDAADLAEIASLVARVEGLLVQVRRRAMPLDPSQSDHLSRHTLIAAGDYLRRPQPPLPDPRRVRQIIRQRRLRERYFESELFADPGWDILLELTAARAEHTRVSVTSLCVAAAVPATTALRWIAMMTEMGLLVRQKDEIDQRRVFITLSDSAAACMARYFDELGRDAARLI